MTYHRYMGMTHFTPASGEAGHSDAMPGAGPMEDQAAFADLMGRHHAYAYALAMRFVWDEAEAEDVVQEAFLRVWRHRETFAPERTFTTWLYRIVTRLSLDHLRRRNRWSAILTRPGIGAQEPAAPEDIAHDLDTARTVAIVRAGVERLPEVQRVVFTLRDLQDLSMEEVRAITGMSADAIKANLYHARKRMRRLLRAHGINDGR